MFAMSRSALSRKEKYAVAVLSVFTFLLRIPLALRPEQSLTVFPYGDDTYYLFSIARNAAAGHGFSVDGIHLTNGFQPLIVLLYTPIFWLCGPRMIGHADSWLAIRWTFVLNGVIAALTVWALAHLIRSCEREKPKTEREKSKTEREKPKTDGEKVTLPWGLTAPVLGALLWTGSISIFAQMAGGLETGLYSLLLCVSMTLYARLLWDENAGVKTSVTRWFLLGLVLGLTVLARIDAAILVAIIVIVELWRWSKKNVTGHLWDAFVMGATALVVSSPWWIYNVVSFGSLMPVSGQAENSWYTPVSANIYRLVQTLDDIALILFYTPHDLSFLNRILCSIAIAVLLYLLLRHTRVTERLRQGMFFSPLLPMALFSIVLVIYYTFFFEAPHFIIRYLQPLRILWVVLTACAVVFLYPAYLHGSARRRRIAGAGIILFSVFSLGFGVERYGYRLHDTTGSEFYKTGVWAAQHPQEKIGMLQSGIASFVAPNVINLDGKVNSDALRAHQSGRLAEYLRDERFTYIADWKPFIEDIDTLARNNELYFDSVGMIDRIQLMKLRAVHPASQ